MKKITQKLVDGFKLDHSNSFVKTLERSCHIFCNTTRTIYNEWHRPNGQLNRKISYPYIPNSEAFVQALFVQYLVKKKFFKNPNMKVLDVGCGFSPFLYMLDILGISSFYDRIGIDIESFCLTFGFNGMSTLRIDAMNYTQYNKMDIIYFYHPYEDHSCMFKLFSKIVDEMKPGAIIVPHPMRVDHMYQKYTDENSKHKTTLHKCFTPAYLPIFVIQKL